MEDLDVLYPLITQVGKIAPFGDLERKAPGGICEAHGEVRQWDLQIPKQILS